MAIDNKALGVLNALKNQNDYSHPSQHALNKRSEQAAIHSNAQQNRELPEQASIKASQMEIRNERQASLVAHLFGDGTLTQQNTLKITYQAAIEKLNEILSEQMQITPNENQPAPISEEALKSQGGLDYWTPENTAKRIADGAIAFLPGFQRANPELEGEELINHFLDVVGGGLTSGFDEARDILGDLNVLEGEVANNIDRTYGLLQDRLTIFRNQFLGIEPTLDNSAETTVATETESVATTEDKS
ncbi:DUF5610 domain-containing protein [Thiomicrorhabdus sediminis]|uniref:DUF5610 domain-containing protein n=1 Tax=Thiomicrorhabdus sediminis TaxID=2580412 RepID=UPI00143D0984|nr:DUF5610 domain-containing protein [Thiomicrorhabdus sediminis]